jgi:formate dehydrogenase iron-sulfur subunit
MSNQVTVFVPRETSAVSLGAHDVAEKLAAVENVNVVRNGSWGASWLEPLVEVVVGDDRIAYGPVEVGDLDSLLEAGFLTGGKHPLRLGPISEIPYLKNQERWTFWRCGLIDPLSIADFQAHKGFAGLQKAFEKGPEYVLDQIKTSGLRGRGGAGFPTGIKWQTVADTEGEQKYITCNADEGDSGTFSDRLLMEGDPLNLIEGMITAGFAVGASKGYIYLRSEYPLTRRVLTKALLAARDSGWLGQDIQGSGFDFDIDIHIGGGSYVCGEETAMLESLEGKAGVIRYKPPLPAIAGLFGKPTVVNNVVTLGSVPLIMALGGEKYAEFGVGRSKGTLAFQLAGNIKRGGMVEKAFGLTLRELIEDFGGGTATGRPVRAVQVGGPLGAYLTAEQLDTPLDYEAFAEIGGMIGHGGIVVFDDTVDMAAQARFAMEFCAIESCGKCTPCRIGSVRGVEVIDRIVSNEDREENINLLHDLCDTMIDGSLCAMGGMTPFPVRSALKSFPDDFNK